MSTSTTPPSEAYEEEWYLKDVEFNGRKLKIITQNLNGPCSFIAICNVLLLRGDIELAPQRESVTYEYMAQRLGDYLLTHCPGVDVGAALSIMPLTTRGMDLNPLFTGSRNFRPSGDGGALALFEHAGITLVHGWLVDPASPEYSAVASVGDYDTAVTLVAEADHLTQGRLVYGNENFAEAGLSSSAGPSPSSAEPSVSSTIPGEKTLTPQERSKVRDAIHIRTFLDNTSSQLTYHGLFELSSSVQPGQLLALFRNSHLSVLYKPLSSSEHNKPHFSSNNPFAHAADTEADAEAAAESSSAPPSDPHEAARVPSNDADPNVLYLLVTDAAFVREPTVVWEALRDVDGQTSSFVDTNFTPSKPIGGDFAGSPGAELEDQMVALAVVDEHDEQLARQLQAEEDARAHEAYLAHKKREQEQQAKRQRAAQENEREHRVKKKPSCIIM